jgi:hypothetical protein
MGERTQFAEGLRGLRSWQHRFSVHDGIEGRDQRCSFALLEMQIDHGCLELGMAEQFFDGMNVDSQVEQVCGEAVPEGMSRVVHVGEPSHFHASGHRMSDGTFMHRPVWDISFEEKFFCSMISIVSSEIIKDEFWKDGEPIFVSFTLHDLDLHGIAVDAGYFEHSEFVESESCTVEQTDHAPVLDVCDGVKQVDSLCLRKDSGELVLFSRIDFRGKHVGFTQHMLEEEAEALGCHATLISPQVE